MRTLVAILLLALYSTVALAQTTQEQIEATKHLAQTHFIFFTKQPSITLLPPHISQAEIAFLKHEAVFRTTGDAFLVNQLDDVALVDLASCAGISSTRTPRCLLLLQAAAHDLLIIAAQASLQFKLAPPDIHTIGLPPITPPTAPYAYPSLFAVSMASTRDLIDLIAAQTDSRVHHATDSVFRLRLRAGMDWPSGIACSEDLVHQAIKALSSNPRFNEQLRLARAEFTAAQRSP